MCASLILGLLFLSIKLLSVNVVQHLS